MSADEKNGETISVYDASSFIGDMLGPLFLYEPFSQQTSELYRALAEMDAEEVADEWPLASKPEALASLIAIKQGIEQDADDAILWEYRRLFVGPAKKAAPPWGSVYLDRECVIFGESTLDLRAWMRKNGILGLQNPGDPEDHFGLMLLQMSWISREQPELLPEYLAEHLLPWAPCFLETVEASTNSSFFKGLAKLSSASLKGIANELGVNPIKKRLYR